MMTLRTRYEFAQREREYLIERIKKIRTRAELRWARMEVDLFLNKIARLEAEIMSFELPQVPESGKT